jgi:glycerophosphoryl diester phosphodiesterase
VTIRFAYLDAPTPLAFAHRGGAADGDENTAAAFGRAVAMGYRYLETDTHATADGVPVIFHDDTLDRVLGRSGVVADLTYADLATVRVGGEPVVPRLEDMLGAWPQVRFNIDVKADTAVVPAVEAVRRAGAYPRVLLASFSDARLRRIRAAVGPDVATSLGSRSVARLWAASRLGRAARRGTATAAAAQVPLGAGPVRLVDRRFVAHAHRLGLQVHVWTIDEPDRMRELLDLGVDGIMTDHIRVLRDVYQARGVWAG